MGLQIRVIDGTPRHGKSLCHQCKYAKIVRGQNCEERVVCSSAPLWAESRGVVRFRVADCTQFHPMNIPWNYEMEEMAWVVQARKRGPTGFQSGAGDVKEGDMEVTIRPPNKNEK